MDALINHQEQVDKVVSGLLRPLVDQELTFVFYDMTTIRAAGLSEQAGDVRQYGLSKEGLIKRQCYGDFVDLLDPFHEKHCAAASNEVTGELSWQGLRLVVAHNPDTAREMTQKRNEAIEALEQKACEWTGKLDAQDEGKASRGRKLSAGGARARFYRAVCEARLAKIIKVGLGSELFSYSINEKAQRDAPDLVQTLVETINSRPGD